MARVAESVLPEFGGSISLDKVVTRTLEGAKRYQELTRSLGRQLPVPSILINGELAFETTPGVEELTSHLKALLRNAALEKNQPMAK